ncbi:MAG: recombinase family protein [Candidatus Margulisbacteria bacterium]|nr:recombinase family protein [Candidatus Margulisiibacteriota bacterium]
MKIGYARVSTQEQHLDQQIQQLTEAGCEEIVQEKKSGADFTRPELQTLLKHLRKGDTLVVCKLDRLARSTRHLLDIVDELNAKSANFCSLGEPWADTTSSAGKIIMTIFAGIAEFERDLIRERTDVGRKRALKRGVQFGRPKKLAADQKKLILEMKNNGASIQELANAFHVNRSTIYRLLAV